ncbi:hypothetical protein CARUB_v10018701mg [Capsella rubella]|uniref:S-protein homolog n=1 Tax=Capsella rubella TaxID=81985 RepID=R0H7S8_9BRAS|nr:S-protein homolog 5 [Capsella rubella]EOA25369.1 hypothetical protein CARUB_v10018701mg [Capsella rubella]
MSFTNKSHVVTLLFVISSILVLFVSALDFSNVPAEAPSSGEDGFLPLAKKHVVIRNKVRNRETLDVHCHSRDDDLGLIHIPWNQSWDFRFHVNIWKRTKFVCQFSWLGGGTHFFSIFKVSRDDSIIGYPVCQECIWEVGKYHNDTICRINSDGSLPFCFKMGDHF